MIEALKRSYYLQPDVVELARDLIGKTLCVDHPHGHIRSIITETEAYAGIHDKASHAYGGKCTQRTEVMYEQGGITYVYLCYGMHHMLNVVTNERGTPHAILIRGVEIQTNHSLVEKLRGVKREDRNFMNGPGKVTQGLGITLDHNRNDLCSGKIRIAEGQEFTSFKVEVGPRIGIGYAEEDAELPYRFLMKKHE